MDWAAVLLWCWSVFHFFREFSDLIVPTHLMWYIPHIMHPYILIHVFVVFPRISIQVVCCCEKLFKALSRASPPLINQEEPIFSISHQNKAASACLLLSYVVTNAFCLAMSKPIQLHLWWSSMAGKFKWLRCWVSSRQSFDQRALQWGHLF